MDILSSFDDLVAPLFSHPRKMPTTAWSGHIPFLFCLFNAIRPKRYAELGVHTGASLIAASTASEKYGCKTELFGIDLWSGDKHAGFYEGDPILSELKTYMDANFPAAKLVQSSFDDALPKFADKSLDILHIDGLHTYEAVKHDYETWRPKVADNGIILLHDISVLRDNFGVHQFWDELKAKNSTVEFHHSNGLGVVLLDPNRPIIRDLYALFTKTKTGATFYQQLVENVGNTLPLIMESGAAKREINTAEAAQVILKLQAPWLLPVARTIRRMVG